ncbi:MAG: helix-turn-helix transcriptional regulator [Gemmatimonadetes bacterium]|jgi:transcriptional regulator with XRE-family HTH domain|nr:helix-turn-helix transcriptional regulator [Gemmatimonadota bacterium]MBT5056895.1 helix-turn-helix transcriptional regulator [Gemmatimonadota bacterium]MBT5141268.1 helix-turn-helix transcriptional regulator [Gemmatimonadota bacterium]MBT5590349.1 helix-turn-helix transcriptional regulator [Gemmatimonadota bacterium]MBT5963882.1 helix-turn-helix transcriptional regulator [Gemmatimonadota bacterium]
MMLRTNGNGTNGSAANGSGTVGSANAPQDYCGYHFRIARQRLGLSQVALARQLHIDQSAVSRLERGMLPNPSWHLIQEICVVLNLEPHAMIGDAIDNPSTALQPIAQLRGRVAMHFLYVGYHERLPELLGYCLRDLQSVRPTLTALSLTLFTSDKGVRHCYAVYGQGEIQTGERRAVATRPVCALMASWRENQVMCRQTREELPVQGEETALAIDHPLSEGMLGFDLREEELADTESARFWVAEMAEPFVEGMRLVNDRSEIRRQQSELTEVG